MSISLLVLEIFHYYIGGAGGAAGSPGSAGAPGAAGGIAIAYFHLIGAYSI